MSIGIHALEIAVASKQYAILKSALRSADAIPTLARHRLTHKARTLMSSLRPTLVDRCITALQHATVTQDYYACKEAVAMAYMLELSADEKGGAMDATAMGVGAAATAATATGEGTESDNSPDKQPDNNHNNNNTTNNNNTSNRSPSTPYRSSHPLVLRAEALMDVVPAPMKRIVKELEDALKTGEERLALVHTCIMLMRLSPRAPCSVYHVACPVPVPVPLLVAQMTTSISSVPNKQPSQQAPYQTSYWIKYRRQRRAWNRRCRRK